MSTAKSRLPKLRWCIALAAVGCLVVDNVWQTVQRARVKHEVSSLSARRAEQTAAFAASHQLRSEAGLRNTKVYADLLRLSKMMRWAKSGDDMLVRSGPHVAGQVVSMGSGKLRLLLYVPDLRKILEPTALAAGAEETRVQTQRPASSASGSQEEPATHGVQFAFKEIWGDEFRRNQTPLRNADPLPWKNRFTLDSALSGVNQIDFVMDDDASTFNVIVNERLAHSFSVQPFVRPGSTFGPYFTKAYPNQAYGWTEPRGQSPRPFNEVLKHSFNLTSKTDRTVRGAIVIRCWLQSNQRVSSSATQAATFFPSMAEELMSKKTVSIGELENLFQPYDGSGRVFFNEAVSQRLMDSQ